MRTAASTGPVLSRQADVKLELTPSFCEVLWSVEMEPLKTTKPWKIGNMAVETWWWSSLGSCYNVLVDIHPRHPQRALVKKFY